MTNSEPYLLEVWGKARGQDVVYYRTVVDGIEGQRESERRLVPLLPEDWRIVLRPLGTMDGIERALRSRRSQQ